MSQYHYGYKPDLIDQRDQTYTAPVLYALPPEMDLRPACPPVYDQQALGSCTANAIAGAIEFDQKGQNLAETTPSRLFIYYNERAKEHTIPVDAGASIRDGVKSVNRQGVCSESIWPYDITQFATRPYPSCYQEALNHRVLSYQRVSRSILTMKACLSSGLPFVFGFTVYESFESQLTADTGIVNLPTLDEAVIGGHAVVAVGYNDAEQAFYVRNSWGDSWGDKGYCYMPYQYLIELASDFWMIRTVS